MRQREVVVLAAHADDEIFGCGATIARLTRDGWRARALVVSSGIVTARRLEQDHRAQAKDAASLVGYEDITFLGLPDQAFDTVPLVEVCHLIESLQLEPDLVLTHNADDLNIDHQVVARASLTAFRPRRHRCAIATYEIPGELAWSGRSWAPNWFVDVSTTFDTKLAAAAFYMDELQPSPDPRSLDGLERLARQRGSESGLDLAEAFSLVRGYVGSLP